MAKPTVPDGMMQRVMFVSTGRIGRRTCAVAGRRAAGPCRGSSRTLTPMLLLGAACLVFLPSAALADDPAEDLKQLRAAIQKELAALKKREQKLQQEFLRLDQKSQLLDEELRKLRAAGTGGPVIAAPTPPAPPAPAIPARPAATEMA